MDARGCSKKAEMMFLDKGKADISTLDSFRGIGLLQHKYKLLEWGLMSCMWRNLMRAMDEEVLGFLPSRSGCQALWRVRAETDYRIRQGKPWVWLSMDVKKAFDTIMRVLKKIRPGLKKYDPLKNNTFHWNNMIY